MLTTLRSRLTKIPRWLQFTVVLVAGVASFLLTFQLGMRDRDVGSNAISTIVRPAKASASAPAVDLGLAAGTQSPASLAAPSRLTPGILQNPFAPLNLHASMDKPVVVAVAEPVREKKPVPRPTPVVAPPPPAAQLPAPAPTAPPLPFVVLGAIQGKSIAQGRQVVFLNDKGVSLAVSQGDDIHGLYKVEAINANSIEFTYLPLGQRQSLSLAK